MLLYVPRERKEQEQQAREVGGWVAKQGSRGRFPLPLFNFRVTHEPSSVRQAKPRAVTWPWPPDRCTLVLVVAAAWQAFVGAVEEWLARAIASDGDLVWTEEC